MAQRLLVKPVKSHRAPPLSDNQLAKIPLVIYTEDGAPQFRFCTDPAIRRFRENYDALATSSDEEGDGEDATEQSTGANSGLHDTHQSAILHTEKMTRFAEEEDLSTLTGCIPEQREKSICSVDTMDSQGSGGNRTSSASTLLHGQIVSGIFSQDKSTISIWVENYLLTDRFVSLREPPRLHLTVGGSGTVGSCGLPSTDRASFSHRRSKIRWKRVTRTRIMRDLPAYCSTDLPKCSVCEDPFWTDDILRQLPCQHAFHMSCVDRWLILRMARCPLCKYNVTPSRDAPVLELPTLESGCDSQSGSTLPSLFSAIKRSTVSAFKRGQSSSASQAVTAPTFR
ncbi:hypothetical protein IWQ60_000940 [Tieghemiomyces parasiticus]|uniref:RING-type domain-containing protein n=1 Tax=Tieghemiomyces parasiticus TaxID=78921 RepID=A0A9W8AEY8_9FUNG|nr:hypothetical protein IWQ60_000940 [Tieghemiomyces parasiticus]